MQYFNYLNFENMKECNLPLAHESKKNSLKNKDKENRHRPENLYRFEEQWEYILKTINDAVENGYQACIVNQAQINHVNRLMNKGYDVFPIKVKLLFNGEVCDYWKIDWSDLPDGAVEIYTTWELEYVIR